jgi:hypothetical protein
VLNHLYQLNNATIFFLMIVVTTFFSLFFIVSARIFGLFHLKYRDNSATASIASMIGIIYALLTGVLCLYLLNNQDHATEAALSEGTAVATIYRESKWLKAPTQQHIQKNLRVYINNVLEREWPAMAGGQDIHNPQSATFLIEAMSNALMLYPINTQADAVIVDNLLQSFRNLFKARQERISMTSAQLSDEIWFVIFLSTALIIFINYTFRLEFKLHLLSITAISIMAASVLFLLVTLDRPFQGEFTIEPKALRAVLMLMDQEAKLSAMQNSNKQLSLQGAE